MSIAPDEFESVRMCGWECEKQTIVAAFVPFAAANSVLTKCDFFRPAIRIANT